MNYKEFFQDKNLAKALAVTVATDALGHKANTLAVSIAPVMDPDKVTAILVAGGNPDANSQFTGISPEKYAQDAYGLGGAKDTLTELLRDYSFIVTYAYRLFTQAQLIKTFPEIFMGKFMVDIVNMQRIRDIGEEQAICAKAKSVRDLSYEIEMDLMQYRGGLKFHDALHKCGLPLSELPAYQAAAVNTARLFQHLVLT